MKLRPNEVFIYYDDSSYAGRQTAALAHTLSAHIIERMYLKDRMSTTFWQDLLDMLKLQPKQLLNKAHPTYQATIRGKEFDDEGWLNVLQDNPNLIKAPIAIRRGRAILCQKPTDILKI